jgi:hypothetical protein
MSIQLHLSDTALADHPYSAFDIKGTPWAESAPLRRAVHGETLIPLSVPRVDADDVSWDATPVTTDDADELPATATSDLGDDGGTEVDFAQAVNEQRLELLGLQASGQILSREQEERLRLATDRVRALISRVSAEPMEVLAEMLEHAVDFADEDARWRTELGL